MSLWLLLVTFFVEMIGRQPDLPVVVRALAPVVRRSRRGVFVSFDASLAARREAVTVCDFSICLTLMVVCGRATLLL